MCLQCSFLHSLVESLCSFFYSSTVHSYCQLADSCFIILFQNLNPKKWKRERGGELNLLLHQSIPSAPHTSSCKTSGGSLRIAQWSKGMKMTCYLHCFVMEFWRGGVAKYLERRGWKHVKTWQGFMNNYFFSLYTCLSVKHACYVQSKWVLTICWRKQWRHSFWPGKNSKPRLQREIKL